MKRKSKIGLRVYEYTLPNGVTIESLSKLSKKDRDALAEEVYHDAIVAPPVKVKAIAITYPPRKGKQ